MKVAIVTAVFPQVSETFAVRHAEALEADVFGHQVDRDLLQKMNYTGSVFGPAKAAGAKAGQRHGSSVSRWANHLFQPLRNFQPEPVAAREWREYLDRHKPDVVLAEFAPNAMSVLPDCLERKIPVVAHFHGMDASRLMRHWSYRRALQHLFRDAAAVVCVSNPMRSVLVQAGCPPGKLRVIPCGAPVDQFTPSTEAGRQPCHFVAVGRMIPGKGPLVTLRAFLHALKQQPDIRLTMIGGGPLEAEARALVEQEGCGHAAEVAGPRPNPEVRALLGEKASVFLQASITSADGWWEGWGVSIAEALACGLPAIVTRSGGMTDLVIDSYNGFLFEEGDWREMSRHMLVLARDPDLRARMGRAGREHVERVGSTGKNIAALAALLQEVCKLKQSALDGRDGHL
jgi:colanic acid/amylovoran biosynthesis glycosyltransferase